MFVFLDPDFNQFNSFGEMDSTNENIGLYLNNYI